MKSSYVGSSPTDIPVLPLDATDVEVAELGTATYDDVQDVINFFSNRGIISGGTITTNGDGSCTVAAGTGSVQVTDSVTAQRVFFDFAQDSSVSLSDKQANYIMLDYNGGTPQVVAAAEPVTTSLQRDHFPVGVVYRSGTTLTIINPDYSATDAYSLGQLRDFEIDGIARSSGMATSSTGTRNLAITAGVMWAGYYRLTSSSFDTSATDTFSYWYTSDSGTSWTEVTSQTQIDNTQYNDITSGLSTLSNNKFGVHWVYLDFGGANLHVVYGQGDYSATEAEDAGVPSNLPPICSGFGFLIAKIIVQKSSDTLTIGTPWSSTITSSLLTSHANLTNLAWTTSGHTGTASKVASFSGAGAAAEKTVGIADDNLVEMDDADAADNDYAKFTANGLEGRSYAETRTDLSLGFSCSITVEDPGAAEDITIAFTNKAITITEIRAVLIGSSTPSVTWTIRHNATDRSAAGNEVVTGGTTTTSTTSGSDVTSFNDATIPADSFIWLETTAQSGTVTELHITAIGTID